jgi:hypothetical protein
MKTLLTVTTLALTGLALTAWAQNNQAETKPSVLSEQTPVAQPPKAGGRFAKIDANADGFVSKAEYIDEATARAQERFTKIDTNNDGQLTREEMKAGTAKMRERLKEARQKRQEQRGQSQGSGDSAPEAPE